MELKCECLNVTICVQQTTFGRTVDLESLKQDNQEDPFNGCCLNEMDLDVAGISMEQSSLVSERLYGDLRVFKCHGCGMVTHSSHQHKLGRLFVNSKLVSDSAIISDLRLSSSFSQVFGVVLPPDYNSGFPDVERLQHNLGPSVAQAQQIVDTFVMAEEAAVQTKIQAFIEEQNMVLTRIKQKAQQDLRSLYDVMSSIPVSDDRRPRTEAAATKYTASSDRPEILSTVYPTEHSLSRLSDVPVHDAGIFCMDDMDGPTRDDKSAFLSDDDDDDDASTDNSFQGSQIGIAMATRPGAAEALVEERGAWMLGKSAPVGMPARACITVNADGFMHDDGLTPSFEDIGNTIKALAQSVQDQSTLLFGELPRPRTATSFIDTAPYL